MALSFTNKAELEDTILKLESLHQFLICLGCEELFIVLQSKNIFSIQSIYKQLSSNSKLLNSIKHAHMQSIIENSQALCEYHNKKDLTDIVVIEEVRSFKFKMPNWEAQQQLCSKLIYEGSKMLSKKSEVKQPKSINICYLNEKRIHSISLNIAEFKNLKYLYLNGNYIQQIENLDSLTSLVSLDLSENFLRQIQNFSMLKQLETLNLSHNQIIKIDQLSSNTRLLSLDVSNQKLIESQHLTIDCHTFTSSHISLEKMNLSNNRIEDPDIMNLKELKGLRNLILSGNHLRESNCLIELIRGLDKLETLSLENNPVVFGNKNLRTTIIFCCSALLELNGREVKNNERSYVHGLFNRDNFTKGSSHKLDNIAVLAGPRPRTFEKPERMKMKRQVPHNKGDYEAIFPSLEIKENYHKANQKSDYIDVPTIINTYTKRLSFPLPSIHP